MVQLTAAPSGALRGRSSIAMAGPLLLLATALAAPPLWGQESATLGLSSLLDADGFVRVLPGEFLMGSNSGTDSERPAHRVRITAPFELGRFEVTQAQWDAVMRTAHQAPAASGGATPPPATDVNPSHFRGPAQPVENVPWTDVQRFLAALMTRDTAHRYRLPTEAEWEYAARSGGTEETVADLPTMAWFAENSLGQPHPPGGKAANRWGLYDMQGNVAEWVADWFAPDYYQDSPPSDPTGPEMGSYRVYRGCSWLGPASDCRPSSRAFDFPTQGYYNVGFRVVRVPR